MLQVLAWANQEMLEHLKLWVELPVAASKKADAQGQMHCWRKWAQAAVLQGGRKERLLPFAKGVGLH
eukprot:6100707-Prorocentrum_lima.AAC.1